MNIMMGVFYAVIICASLAELVLFLLYKRRMKKILKGEARDTHIPVPEPRTTLKMFYCLIMLTFTLSIMGGISSLDSALRAQNDKIDRLSSGQYEILQRLDDMEKHIKSSSFEITDIDTENMTFEFEYSLLLKEYSDNTEVSLKMTDGSIYPLINHKDGTFSNKIKTDILKDCSYDEYGEVMLIISENGKKVTDSEYLPVRPDDILPFASYQRLKYDERLYDDIFKAVAKGTYSVIYNRAEDLSSVSVTYLKDGKEYKTEDITDKVLSGSDIAFPDKLTAENEIALHLYAVTKSGLITEERNTIVSGDDCDDYRRLLDQDGNILWEWLY